jgi:2-aminoadipate transaminase
MLGALADHFGNGATWSRPQGGIFIWLKLPEGQDAAAIRNKVLETADVGYGAGPGFAPDGVSGKNCMRLCFGYNTPDEIREGIARLADAFEREGVLSR